MTGLDNWTDGNNSSICADQVPFPTWSEWGASQRDLFIIDLDGNVIFHENITSGVPEDLEDTILGILNVESDPVLPNDFNIYQNFPNPFNPETNLIYDLPNDAYVRLTIYNIIGNEVKSLINGYESAGQKRASWDATNNVGNPVPAGVYFYTIEAGSFNQTKRMIYLK